MRENILLILTVSLVLIVTFTPVLNAQSDNQKKESTSSTDEIKKAQIKRIDTEIKIDGLLDDSEWKDAPLIGPLIQNEPKPGAEPTFKTDVKILYNSDYIYFGIICYDDHPDKIVAYNLERDLDPGTDDAIAVIIDTFNDKRNGYWFTLTPEGSRMDGAVTNNNPDPDDSWDGIWYGDAEITSFGWTAEVAVPFKTINFDPSGEIWGFNFLRLIKRFEEFDRWSNPSLDYNWTNLSIAGEIHGLKDINQGIGLDIKPYVVGGVMREEEGDTDVTYNSGVDVFYNITSNLKASLTVNTDFAETEVDSRQINLSRFPITYPEKRDFFLEGGGYFKFARLTTNLIPFLSRRIGLYEDEKVPLLLGLKINGKIGPYNIGFLDTQMDSTDKIDTRNLLSLRLTRDILEQSYVGITFTNGDPSGEGYNRLYGADLHLGTSKLFGNKNVFLDINYYKTDSENLPDDLSYSWQASIDYPNDDINASIEYQEIGENFNPSLGFLRRADIKRYFGNFFYMPRIDWLGIRKLEFGTMMHNQLDFDNNLLEGFLMIKPLGIVFDSGDWLEFDISVIKDNFEEDFEIWEDVIIPPGDYTFHNYEISAGTSTARPIYGNFRYSFGPFYEGDVCEYEASVTYKPGKHILLNAYSFYSDRSVPAGSFTARIQSLRINLYFNTSLSWKNYIQYDNFSELLGIFSKIRWNIEDGTELFIVFEKNWKYENKELVPYNWRVDLKFNYTFRL